MKVLKEMDEEKKRENDAADPRHGHRRIIPEGRIRHRRYTMSVPATVVSSRANVRFAIVLIGTASGQSFAQQKKK